MKIALISGNIQRQGFPPLGILYLAGYIRKYYPDAILKVFDFIPEENEVIEFSPDIIGISAFTLHYSDVYKYCESIREKYNV